MQIFSSRLAAAGPDIRPSRRAAEIIIIKSPSPMKESCVINPQRLPGEPQLPATGILAVNPSDKHSFSHLAQRYDLQRSFLFNAHLYASDRFFVAGPAVGAPMAAICLEKLIVLGASKIVLYGWCGSLTPALRVGDVFVPTSAFSEEGTSSHYQVKEVVADVLSDVLAAALATWGLEPKKGCIWTTDAVYRETREKIKRYSADGILAVDMEFAALQAVARFRGVSLAAVLLVSDELYAAEWNPNYRQKNFRACSHNLLARLCNFMQTMT
ncbi:nucleoside phosphorylase [Desulfobulbus alkaliphilus]|uniref:nucleoside phosphorylase n=1 Tax=Desulfobulbus alkaliphilus TaxID=869814 RepID=UPI0019664D1A|nr:nucleoside phosphorylase [Desulfobulbus alkaliphilus]MBM9536832.1 nucleoside phosphorylase [Desulfobulbus alkaliphilus]